MRLTTADLDIDLPAGWERAPMPGMDGFAYAPLRHPRFRTTAAIVGVESSEPLEAASRTAVEQVLAGFDAPQVLGVDVWAPGREGAEGRQITFTAALPDGQQICLTQWIWATGSRHVCLATSIGMPDALLDAPTLHNLAVTARLSAPSAGSTDGALEDLRWVAERQRYQPTGRHVPEGALPSVGDELTVADLAELGLLGEDGPTELGSALTASRGASTTHISLRARRGSSFSEIGFTPLDRGHVIEAGPPVWRLEAADPGPWLPGSIELTVASFDAGPAVAARWLGLAPVWSRDLGAIRIDRATLEAKVSGRGAPVPPGMRPLAQDAWRQPWTHVELEVAQHGGEPTLRMEWIRTPEHGWLAVDDHDGRLRLTALRSVTLFHRLQQAFGLPIPQTDRAAAQLR